jgi:undecaprenyl pyrophosphate phosphatase UppP
VSAHLTYPEAIILGLFQGVTELFPVSSLGHSVLIPALVGGSWEADLNVTAAKSPYLAFIVAMHVATAIAMIIYFWRDWLRIVRGFFGSLGQIASPAPGTGRFVFRETEQKLAWMIILGTIPVGIAGVLLDHPVRTVLAKPIPTAIFLAFNGLLLFGGEFLRRRRTGLDAQQAVADRHAVAADAAGGGWGQGGARQDSTRDDRDGPGGPGRRTARRDEYRDRAGYSAAGQAGYDQRGYSDQRGYGDQAGYRDQGYDARGGYGDQGHGSNRGYRDDPRPYGDRGGYGRSHGGQPDDDRGYRDDQRGGGRRGYVEPGYDQRGDDQRGDERGGYGDRRGYGNDPRGNNPWGDDQGGYDRRGDHGGLGPRGYGDGGGMGEGPRGNGPWGGDPRRDDPWGDSRGGYDRQGHDQQGYEQQDYYQRSGGQRAARHSAGERDYDERHYDQGGYDQRGSQRVTTSRRSAKEHEADLAIQADQRLVKLSFWSAIVLGAWQILALLPGFSRDGSVMVGGLARGLSRHDAARFSFLLSAPVILAAGVFKAGELFGPETKGIHGPIIAGMIVSGIGAYFALKFLDRFLSNPKRTLTPFAIYCLVMGLFSLIYLGF